eukprot:COSAG06_NODE_2795_length_6270_cov_78.849943_3_plen_325_part_00
MVGCVPHNTKRQVHWGGRDTLATHHKARKHTLQAALSSRCRLHVPPHHPPRPAQRLRRQPQLSAGRTDCRPAAATSRHPPSHGTPHCGPPALRPAEHTQPVAARRRHNAPRLAQGHWHCGQASRRAAAAPWLWPSPDPVASACRRPLAPPRPDWPVRRGLTSNPSATATRGHRPSSPRPTLRPISARIVIAITRLLRRPARCALPARLPRRFSALAVVESGQRGPWLHRGNGCSVRLRSAKMRKMKAQRRPTFVICLLGTSCESSDQSAAGPRRRGPGWPAEGGPVFKVDQGAASHPAADAEGCRADVFVHGRGGCRPPPPQCV